MNLSFGKHSLTAGGGLRRVQLSIATTAEAQYAATNTATLSNANLPAFPLRFSPTPAASAATRTATRHAAQLSLRLAF